MSKNKSIILIVIVLLVALFASSIVYDIFTHDIENKELNLSIAEDANRSSMSISGFQYDSWQKGYGAYQNDRYNYEEHQRKYERRRADIESLKTKRNLISVFIGILGISIAFLIYKRSVWYKKEC